MSKVDPRAGLSLRITYCNRCSWDFTELYIVYLYIYILINYLLLWRISIHRLPVVNKYIYIYMIIHRLHIHRHYSFVMWPYYEWISIPRKYFTGEIFVLVYLCGFPCDGRVHCPPVSVGVVGLVSLGVWTPGREGGEGEWGPQSQVALYCAQTDITSPRAANYNVVCACGGGGGGSCRP